MAVSFNNIPSNIRVPLFYAEVDNSMANTATADLKTLLVGQMTAEGKATAGQPVLVSSDSIGKELFGRGSVLALMNSAYRENDTYGEVWAIPVEDPTGGAKASGTFTITGEATATGSVYAYIGAERVMVNVAIGDDAATIATNLAAAINAKLDLPVTAAAEEGIVTLNAKNAGTWGNDIHLTVNLQGYAAGESDPEGIGITVAGMSGGTGVPDLSGVVTAMGDEAYDFIAMPYNDITSLDTFKTAMNDVSGRWSPMSQIYGHVYSAMRGTVSALQAFGAVRNDQHATIIGIEPDVPSLAVEILGAFTARCARSILNDPARPLQTLELIGITPAAEGSRFTLSEKQTLLTSGIATTYTAGGYMRIERAITTYQTNAFGDADNSYLDSETLHTLAYIIRSLKTAITSKYNRHKLANDGTRYGSGQAVVTPSVIRGELIAQYAKLEARAIVEDASRFADNLIVERNATDPNRVDVLLPPDLVNGLRIFAVLTQFRLQY